MTARTNRPFLRAEAGFLSSDDCIVSKRCHTESYLSTYGETKSNQTLGLLLCGLEEALYVVAVKNVVKNDDIVVL